jgi:hypothetical protein
MSIFHSILLPIYVKMYVYINAQFDVKLDIQIDAYEVTISLGHFRRRNNFTVETTSTCWYRWLVSVSAFIYYFFQSRLWFNSSLWELTWGDPWRWIFCDFPKGNFFEFLIECRTLGCASMGFFVSWKKKKFYVLLGIEWSTNGRLHGPWIHPPAKPTAPNANISMSIKVDVLLTTRWILIQRQKKMLYFRRTWAHLNDTEAIRRTWIVRTVSFVVLFLIYLFR